MKFTFDSDNGVISFEYPDEVTHRVKGVDYKIDLKRLNEAGWRAWLLKGQRVISDGSPDAEAVERKIDALYGIAKPLRSRVARDPVASKLMTLVCNEAARNGIKTKDIPKFGKTVEDVTAVARGLGFAASWVKKATARAKAIAELESQEL